MRLLGKYLKYLLLFTDSEIKRWVRFYALLSRPSTDVYGDLHSSYRQLRECAHYSVFISKTVALVGLCGPETALARLYWLERCDRHSVPFYDIHSV